MNKIEAGTKIIITTPWVSEDRYKQGDIFTVNSFSAPGVYVTIGEDKRFYIASDEFEVYTEPEYKVGDIAELTEFYSNREAGYKFEVHRNLKVTEGTLLSGNGVDDGKYIGVYASRCKLAEAPEPEPLAEWEKELLNATPRTITFTDIQEGDLIKAEYSEGGVKHTVEGVAGYHYDNTGNWVTSRSGGYVAYEDWEAAYTLLERPEPPKPNPFAEANVGSVATSNESTPRFIWVKESEEGWRAYSVGGDYRSSHPTSDEALHADSSMKITYNA